MIARIASTWGVISAPPTPWATRAAISSSPLLDSPAAAEASANSATPATNALRWPIDEPTASRPYMPDYGIKDDSQGTGLLPWSWACERLIRSHDYWVATRWPDGRPHVMPVWGVWQDGAVWFSSGHRSRKARNLAADPGCAVTTDDAQEPVVVDCLAELVTDMPTIAAFTGWINAASTWPIKWASRSGPGRDSSSAPSSS
jgi:hypothetical protein